MWAALPEKGWGDVQSPESVSTGGHASCRELLSFPAIRGAAKSAWGCSGGRNGSNARSVLLITALYDV